jgi:hypothetical protein
MMIFLFGLVSGYLIRGQTQAAAPAAPQDQPAAAVAEPAAQPVSHQHQVNPPGGYQLPVTYGQLGPQLLAAGAIDYDRFVQTYASGGRPLTDDQLAILTSGSDEPIVVNGDNAYFLLNFFWAFGLTNESPLLEEGPISQYSEGDVGRFASTGGWTIGHKPATELFSSARMVVLTQAQQELVERVAQTVYRPCCDNHTAFPDCNHGLAMLGLLELLAAQGATEEAMYEAARWVNAFWFPQQAAETAAFFEQTLGLAYASVDPRQAVGREVFSGSGFRAVHQYLAENGGLPQAPGGGGSCGV